MEMKLHLHQNGVFMMMLPTSSSLHNFASSSIHVHVPPRNHLIKKKIQIGVMKRIEFNPIDNDGDSKNIRIRRNRREFGVVASTSSSSTSVWESLNPDKNSASPSLSDIFWPSAGAFAAMAIFGKVDQILAPKGISMTIAPLGAVCAVLFLTPSSPGARKYNMFMAQIGCAAIGVVAFSLFGPGWLARSVGLAASIAFMIFTRSTHPPAASLPLLFIDGAKFHHLNFWYALFPGAFACILLCLIQEMVCYLKDNIKF